MYAAVQIRGSIGASPDVRRTLQSLRLLRKHACVILPEIEQFHRMLRIVQGFVTYGKVSKDVALKLLIKRGELDANAAEAAMASGKLPVLHLHPPRGGFKGGIKRSFAAGGSLGQRKEAIDELLLRMI